MTQSTKCCVIGAGRIGLPISVSLALAGHDVIILENDRFRVKSLNNGVAPFYEEGMSEPLEKLVRENKIIATYDKQRIEECEVIISAIGTGLGEDNLPDLDSIETLLEILTPHVQKGSILILKTTLPLGMTDLIANKLSISTKMLLDEELMVAFSPERIVEGSAMKEIKNLPKIIGGIGPKSTKMATQILSSLGGDMIIVSNPKTAEMCKLLDNSYRMTRFGFAADIAAVASFNGINAYEAIKASNKGYSRNNIPMPSIGVSGYCLTKDPYYLDAGAPHIWEDRGFPSTWISARRAADNQTKDAFIRIKNQLDNNLKGKLIIIGGITYKENIDDIRLSHGRILLELLKAEGARIKIWDNVTKMKNVDGIEVYDDHKVLLKSDCLVITVPHFEFIKWNKNKQSISNMRNKLIFDGWGIIDNFDNKDLLLIGTGR